MLVCAFHWNLPLSVHQQKHNVMRIRRMGNGRRGGNNGENENDGSTSGGEEGEDDGESKMMVSGKD